MAETLELKPESRQQMRGRIAVVVATYKRPAIVERMVGSLATESEVSVICIVDNGSEPELKPLLEKLDSRVRYIDAGSNLGCGGGLARGFSEALKDKSITHIWIVDDDAVIVSGCARRLLKAMEQAGAEVGVPLISGPDGKINSFPGPLKAPAWQQIRKAITPEQFVAACGNGPWDFTWAPGVCVLVTRRTAEEIGGPRADYWLMGEDVEYTCRLTARYRAILAPEARAMHLQPPPQQSQTKEILRRYNFVKFCAFLTNTTYTSINFSHGRRLIKHLPGNYLRFMRNYGWTFSNARRAFQCFLWGGICRLPAGSSAFQKFKANYLEHG